MTLREKLRRLHDDSAPVDAQETIATWRRAIDQLYARVRVYLAGYERDGLITFETREVDRSEEALGTYVINMLVLNIGRQVLMFSPAARYDIGGDGRVDVYVQGYVSRRVRLRWLPTPEPDGTWAISLEHWGPTTGRKVTRRFTKETLEEALDLLLD